MKIKIEFTGREKLAMFNTMEIADYNDSDDKSAKAKGRFGSIEYNKEQNFVEFNFSETFMMAMMSLIASAMNLLKSFVLSIKMFADSWLDDIEIVTEEKSKEQPADSKLKSVVRRATDEEKSESEIENIFDEFFGKSVKEKVKNAESVSVDDFDKNE